MSENKSTVGDLMRYIVSTEEHIARTKELMNACIRSNDFVKAKELLSEIESETLAINILKKRTITVHPE